MTTPQHLEALMKLTIKVSESLIEEGTDLLEYSQQMLHVFGVPLHQVPDDANECGQMLFRLLPSILQGGVSDDLMARIWELQYKLGGPKTRKFLAAEMAVAADMIAGARKLDRLYAEKYDAICDRLEEEQSMLREIAVQGLPASLLQPWILRHYIECHLYFDCSCGYDPNLRQVA